MIFLPVSLIHIRYRKQYPGTSADTSESDIGYFKSPRKVFFFFPPEYQINENLGCVPWGDDLYPCGK